MGGKRVENKKTGLKKFGKVLLIIFVIIIIFAGITTGVGVWYVNDKLGKLNYMEIAEEEIEITEGVKEKLKGYRTIAIFGVDSKKWQKKPILKKQ